MKRLLTVVAVAALVLTASGLMLAQSNPALGTWKLNVAKSKYVNAQAPKSETRTVAAQGAGAKYTFEGVAGDGSRIAWSYTTKYGGEDSPISGAGVPMAADTIASKVNAVRPNYPAIDGKSVNANTTSSTFKKAGKVVRTTTAVVSEDGKITTITSKWTNEQGKRASQTTVFDKQ
jgi:hypothetical protein